MYSNAPKKQKYVILYTSSGNGPQRTAVHGHASHPLWDVIRKLRAGYRGKARPLARQGQLRISVSQKFSAYLTSFSKFGLLA